MGARARISGAAVGTRTPGRIRAGTLTVVIFIGLLASKRIAGSAAIVGFVPQLDSMVMRRALASSSLSAASGREPMQISAEDQYERAQHFAAGEAARELASGSGYRSADEYRNLDLTVARFTHKRIVDHVDPPRGKYGQQPFRDLLYDLVNGYVAVTELRPMKVRFHDGEWWAFDNHRLYAYKLLHHLKRRFGTEHPAARQADTFPYEILPENHRAPRQRMFQRSSRTILPSIRESGRFGSFCSLGHFLLLPGSQVLHLQNKSWVPKAYDVGYYALEGAGRQT
mmetsp:Transcript_60335/g.168569  ORF Transcript_60335/g.168569 Transcript_60335/m.168569 type:complete len:283 (+) Transcript_60335:71-919(+)